MSDFKRRFLGALAGAVFGFGYSLISQYINVWALPDLPLFEFPIGRAASVFWGTFAMGTFGLIVAWEEGSLMSLIVAAFFGVVASSIGAFYNSGGTKALTSFFIFLYTLLPRLILYIPLGALTRWAVTSLDFRARGSLRLALLAWTVLILAAGGGGYFARYPEEARLSLTKTDALLQEGMKYDRWEDLPEELKPVRGFIPYARGAYTLEWSAEADRLGVTRPVAGYGVVESLIIVRFENGFHYGCVLSPPAYKPACLDIHVP